MQGNQTKNDARPLLAVLNYILDKACLSYQEHYVNAQSVPPLCLADHEVGITTLISVGASMSVMSSKRFSNPPTYSPNSGPSGHPCFTSMRHLKIANMPCDDRTASLSSAYRDLMTSRIVPVRQAPQAPAIASDQTRVFGMDEKKRPHSAVIVAIKTIRL